MSVKDKLKNPHRSLKRSGVKKTPTRKQEQAANARFAQAMAENQKAQAAIYGIYLQAYRKAVELYFGSDLPAELMQLLEVDIKAGIEDAATNGKDVDLLPTITQLVNDFVAAQEATGHEAAAADMAANDLMVQTEEQFKQVMMGEASGSEE